MKLLGRIILLAVGGVLLYLSISSIISSIHVIQAQGWENVFSKDTLNAVLQLLTQIFYALGGLYSIFLALKGKSTFISFIIAAILVAIVVYRTIQFTKSGAEINFENIFNLILAYLMPIGFSLGVIFLTMEGKHRD